jgi:hypothetical protein
LNGLHNGEVPFGYRRCFDECKREHEGKCHTIPEKAEAVKKIFEYYASGSWSLSKLAVWLNEQGFRTHNKRGGTGAIVPKLFTSYSVRWLLHNPFFTGKVRYKDTFHQGLHEPIIEPWLFEEVQKRLKVAKTSGRSLAQLSRIYLLKGLVKCIYCGNPLWSETST